MVYLPETQTVCSVVQNYVYAKFINSTQSGKCKHIALVVFEQIRALFMEYWNKCDDIYKWNGINMAAIVA